MDLFHRENLGALTEATTRKLYSLVNAFRHPERAISLGVLQDWHRTGDGSRFSRGHLEFAELKELEDKDCAQVLKKYAAGPHTCVLKLGTSLIVS